MPRFLDTFTGEFRWIENPATIIYAILSHTWRSEAEGSEQNYTEVRKLQDDFGPPRILVPRDLTCPLTAPGAESFLSHPKLSDKIKDACRIAREAGFRLIWIDSCCIDKTSSAELAEAINSMYELYRLSTVCFVYLADVPDNGADPSDRARSTFARSRWHKRGWTLQELIAPARVVFLTDAWTFLGTKRGLAATLMQVSRIDIGILTGRTSLESVSVAKRMSWASARETTRVEDEAYSLLGIFGVHLSPIYGEGRNAFLRLQEEIVRTVPDQSIFAWGPSCALRALDQAECRSEDASSEHPTGLLASSPREFRETTDIKSVSHTDFLSLLSGGSPSLEAHPEVPPLHCVFTPQGIRLQVLAIDLAELPQVATAAISIPYIGLRNLSMDDYGHCLELGRACSLAILRCTGSNDELIALALFGPASGEQDHNSGVSIATHAKCRPSCPGRPSYRVVRLTQNAVKTLQAHLSPTPKHVVLLRHSGFPTRRTETLTPIHLWPFTAEERRRRFDMLHTFIPGPPADFQLAPTCKAELRALGFTITPLSCQRVHAGMTVLMNTVLTADSLQEGLVLSQHIQINIVLTRMQERAEGNTGVSFAVAHFVHEPAGQDPWKPPCAHCKFGGCHTRRVPCGDDGEGVYTKIVRDTVVLPDGVLAQAEFMILGPCKEETPRDPSQRLVRILRLAVECSTNSLARISGRDADASNTRFISGLWLSVDLSDNFPKSVLSR
ncbi:heterokaryon incompatibility protein-domain-containing protein [Lenzites betulinus]|nr:heterokaryon incompatibility protein-domain-containing protein [Lenzites betulinus]